MEAKLKGRNLVITLALQEPKLSPSGKSLVVATSHGFRPTAIKIANQEVWIGVNAFVRAAEPATSRSNLSQPKKKSGKPTRATRRGE